MKKRLLCLMLVCLMVMSCLVPAVVAEENEQEIFPDNSIIQPEEDLQEGEVYVSDEESNNQMPDQEIGSTDGMVIPDDSASLSFVDEEDLGLGEEIFPEESDSALYVEEEDLGGAWENEADMEMGEASNQDPDEEISDELGASPSVYASQSSVTIAKGGSVSVTFSYSGIASSIYLQYAISDGSICSAKWGGWSNHRIPLTIYGNKNGTTYLYVYLKDADSNRTLASTRVCINVGSATLTASTSHASVKAGSAKNVTFTVSGVQDVVYLSYSTTNSSNYSCKWGGWKGDSIDLTIAGKSGGQGTVTVYLKRASDGAVLAMTAVNVTITSDAKLSIDNSSPSVTVGNTVKVNVSYSNYGNSVYMQYGTSNSGALSYKWGSWSGKTCPLYITGVKAGSDVVCIYLKDAETSATLATVSFQVNAISGAKVTASVDTLSISDTGKVTITVSGMSGGGTVSYGLNTSKYVDCKWGSWSGNTVPLTFTAKNSGRTTVTIRLKSKNGTVLDSTSFIVVSDVAQPTIKASRSSVSLGPGSSVSIPITYSGCRESIYYQYSTTNKVAFSTKWSSWSGNTNNLIISGNTPGKGTLTVYLKRASDDKVLASLTISVTVSSNSQVAINDLSYSFDNFSGSASLDLCRYMFGNNSFAKAVFEKQYGAGGNCFGMAASAGIFYVPGNGMTVSSFGTNNSRIPDLSEADRNNSLGLSVSQFVMGMQITQASANVEKIAVSGNNLSKLVSEVKTQSARGVPVLISISGVYRNSKVGHAILACGVESVSTTQDRLLIYDNNFPGSTRYLYLNKNNSGKYTGWHYQIFSDTLWGSGETNGKICYTTYANYYSLWENRGKLKHDWVFVILSSNNANIYDVYDNLVASVVDGELIAYNDSIKEVVMTSVMENVEADPPTMMYLPVALYTVENLDDSMDEFSVEMVDVELGVQVVTTGDFVTLCADDDCDLASAMLYDSIGEEYSITINSSREGDYSEIVTDGTADADMVSMMLDEGTLGMCNVLDVSYGIENVGTEQNYRISVDCGNNGSIVCDYTDTVSHGDNRTYYIIPDSGYEIASVIVDGVDLGAISDYEFRNVQSNHSIQAIFKAQHLRGDVNGDGMVDAADLTVLASHLEQTEILAEEELLLRADINLDGKVTDEDLICLAKYVARIISEWE